MRDQSQQRLQEILKRLGQALHGSAVNSKDVRHCLRELTHEGWDGVMMLSASLACRRDGAVDVDRASLHVHAEPTTAVTRSPDLTASDAELLRSLGIRPTTVAGSLPAPAEDDGPSGDDPEA
jgi:hypothetical protein